MAEHGHKIVYLLVERGTGDYRKTYWRELGAAYECRDGSWNLKLDIHPGLTFNIRNPKSNAEREETEPAVRNSINDPLKDSTDDVFDKAFEDAFNDSTFICNDCRQEKPNEEAYSVFDGGAVCEKCGADYKSCLRCEYYFPKSVKGTHCSKCIISGVSNSNTRKGGER